MAVELIRRNPVSMDAIRLNMVSTILHAILKHDLINKQMDGEIDVLIETVTQCCRCEDRTVENFTDITNLIYVKKLMELIELSEG